MYLRSGHLILGFPRIQGAVRQYTIHPYIQEVNPPEIVARNNEGSAERVVVVADSEHTSACIGECGRRDGACEVPTILGRPSRYEPQST